MKTPLLKYFTDKREILFSSKLNTDLAFKAYSTVTLRAVKSKMDAAKRHTKQPIPFEQQESRISSDEREKVTGCQSTSSEPQESERRPTRSAPPWLLPLVPLNRHANAAAIVSCQKLPRQADQATRFPQCRALNLKPTQEQTVGNQIHRKKIQSNEPHTKLTPDSA